MGNIRCIAVDWSGNRNDRAQERAIWVAEAEQDRLVALEDGRTRLDVVRYLLERIGRRDPLVIGLDFAFSFPQWYLEDNGLQNAPALWARAAEHGEVWLGGNTWPFWGGQNNVYQRLPEGPDGGSPVSGDGLVSRWGVGVSYLRACERRDRNDSRAPLPHANAARWRGDLAL